MSKRKREYIHFVEDIAVAIDKIERFTNNMSFEHFSANEMAVDAVIRNFEVIGEAANKIPEDIKQKYPDMEWSEAIGFRNILIHNYFGVDVEAVWDTIQSNIPQLKKNALNILELEKESP